ncbi:MAG: BamA/TamA family outer membrane protein [Ignavibacteria bacterium]|nr:BamA/TamA family outer membrane protein [Ignavibacteria bacterium]
MNGFSQVKIRSVNISGNDFFSDNDILSMMILKKGGDLSEKQISEDVRTIRNKYKNEGFLLAGVKEGNRIFNSDSTSVELNIDIKEGSRVVIGNIIIEGNEKISKEEILSFFETKTGEVLRDNTLNNDILELLNMYEKRGLPFAKVVIKNVSLYDKEEKLKIEIIVSENSKVQIDQIKIKGNDETKESVILREVKLPKDKTIYIDFLSNLKRRLERLNIFETVDDPKIYSLKEKNKSGLLIQVKEGNTNTFDGILGYVPPANENENGYLTGLANVSFRNLFGTGRRIDAKYQAEVRSTQELSFNYSEPYVFGYPVYANLGFLQRIQDTTYTRRKFDIKTDFLFSDNFTVSGLAGYERIIPTDSSRYYFKIADSQTFLTGLELKYDTRDNIYSPTRGILYITSYSYGTKRIFNIQDLQGLGYQENFIVQRYSMDVEIYMSFLKRQSLLLRGFAGEVRSDKLEDSDFLRIGGNKFIRGYRSEQFLASRLAAGTFEPRYLVSRKSFLFGFYDFGYYFKPEDIANNVTEQSGFLFGYGFGIRLETQLGIIGVSYGLGKGDSFLDGKITFGLINNF